jgi:hypothetical protein
MAFGDATTMVLPISPGHLVALGPHNKVDTLDAATVETTPCRSSRPTATCTCTPEAAWKRSPPRLHEGGQQSEGSLSDDCSRGDRRW